MVFYGTVADQYDSLNEDDKNPLRIMKTPIAMFKNLCKEIKAEFIRAKLNFEHKAREWQRKINNIELWDIRYLKIILLNSVNIITKLGIMKLILACSMTNYQIL